MKAVLHSISYAGLWEGQKYLTLEEFVCKARALGYGAVELTAKRPHLSLIDCDEARLAGLRALLDENRLECAAIAAYTDFSAGAVSGMTPFVEMQQLYIQRLCVAAVSLGCKIIRIFTGFDYADTAFWTQWNACVGAVRVCCDIAAGFGVTIGIQNHHDIAVETSALCDFIDEVSRDNCKAMLDPWTVMLNGEDPEAAIALMRGRLIYSTFADYKQVRRLRYDPALINYTQSKPALKAVRMGAGCIQPGRYLQLLKDAGFDGYIAYEMCSPLQGGGSEENLDSYARDFLEFVAPYVSQVK